MRAVIDIGTNSVRSIWRHPTNGRIMEDIRYTRLGGGISADGIITEEAISRTLTGVQSLLEKMPIPYRSVCCLTATSALREARNRMTVKERIEKTVQLPLFILSTQTEATLGFRGAMQHIETPHDPMVLDIGGGSTEITWFDTELVSASVAVGAVRFQDRPEAYSPLSDYLNPLFVHRPKHRISLVGTGGTITTLAAMHLEMTTYCAEQLHQTTLFYRDLDDLQTALSGLTVDERRALPGLPSSRADIIISGLAILLTVMKGLHCDRIMVSATDMLHALLQLENCPPGLM